MIKFSIYIYIYICLTLMNGTLVTWNYDIVICVNKVDLKTSPFSRLSSVVRINVLFYYFLIFINISIVFCFISFILFLSLYI